LPASTITSTDNDVNDDDDESDDRIRSKNNHIFNIQNNEVAAAAEATVNSIKQKDTVICRETDDNNGCHNRKQVIITHILFVFIA
jgi:hypothetical protein